MGAKVWYVAAGKKKAGPMTSDRLRRQVSVGKLPDGALAWCDGMDSWEPVAAIDRLQPRDESADAVIEDSGSRAVAAPKRKSKSKTGSGKTRTPSKGKTSRSGERKAVSKSGERKAASKAKAPTKRGKASARSGDTALGSFEPLYRLEHRDMFKAFAFGLEGGRIKLALAGMLMPFAAVVVLGGLGVLAAKLHVLLALPVLFAASVAAYALTMVSVGALSYHAKHQLLELERPTVREALRHALRNAAPLSVPPFLLSVAWLVPLIALVVLALVVKIPYVGPVGTGLLFGIHIALGGLTLFLILAAGVAAAFGPVAAAFEETGVKGTLRIVLGFAKRSMARTVAWGLLPSLAMGPFSWLVSTLALAALSLPLLAVFAAVGPETLEWLQAGGVGDAPYPGAMLMILLIGVWIGFVGVVVSAVLGSVHNALVSLLYVGGREGNDSLISRDTYLARCAEGDA